MLKIGVFGFHHPDKAGRHLSPASTRDFIRAAWEIDPPDRRLGVAPPEVPGFIKITSVTTQPVYIQALSDDMASAAGLLNCDGYIAIIDAVKILAPRTIHNALHRLYDVQPNADLIIAAGRQNEPDALSSDEIRDLLGLNRDLLVMPYVPSDPKTAHRLIRRLVRYIDDPDRVPPPIFVGEAPRAAAPLAPDPVEAAGDKKAAIPRIHGLDHVSVIVSDLERALGFYRGLLGFRVLGHLDYPDDTPARIVTHLDTGRGVLELVSFARGAELAGRPTAGAHAANPAFALRVTGLDAIAKPLVAAGVSFTRLPVTTASGTRIAVLTDPDGTLIELIEGDTAYSRR